MELEIERIKTYIRIRWIILTIIVGTQIFETAAGFISLLAGVSGLIGLFILLISNYFLQLAVNKKRFYVPLSFFNFGFDILIMAITFYLNGGPENTWWFLPATAIYVAGYVYDLRMALIYCGWASLCMLAVFLLEFLGIIPHFSLYNPPFPYWKQSGYLADYTIGVLIIYFISALASGFFSRFACEATLKIEKSLKESIAAQEETKKHAKEVERMNEFMVGRELDMIELKKEVNRLLSELGRPEKYRA
jgi:hypothetical protein